jgi:SAM-dependent methyltransferase
VETRLATLHLAVKEGILTAVKHVRIYTQRVAERFLAVLSGWHLRRSCRATDLHYTPDCWSSANPLDRPVIKEAVEFAVRNALTLAGRFPGKEQYLANKTVLEIGPGQDVGIALILIGCGARSVLVDKYMCAWDPAFHPAYYRALRQAIVRKAPHIETTAIDTVIAKGAHIAPGLTTLCVGLEEITDIRTGSVDITYSNATFEHLANVKDAIMQLGRVTAPGGLGFHQIDFRDHRDFSRPLEYLTLTEADLWALLQESKWSCGNAMRWTEFAALFQAAGFQTRFEANMFAADDYLRDILTRMHVRFRDMPTEAFRILSGLFYLEKPRASNVASPIQ